MTKHLRHKTRQTQPCSKKQQQKSHLIHAKQTIPQYICTSNCSYAYTYINTSMFITNIVRTAFYVWAPNFILCWVSKIHISKIYIPFFIHEFFSHLLQHLQCTTYLLHFDCNKSKKCNKPVKFFFAEMRTFVIKIMQPWLTSFSCYDLQLYSEKGYWIRNQKQTTSRIRNICGKSIGRNKNWIELNFLF